MVDLVTRFSAAVGNEIDFGDVRSFIAKLKTERGFNIKMVGTDSWQSYDFRAIMGKMGFQVALLQIEGDHSVYQTFKSVITDERMQGYYRESLVQELNNLEENAGKAVSRSYKDQSDSLCGATCMAIRDTFLPLKSQGASQERVQKGVLGKGLSGLVSPSSGASGGSSRKIGGPNIAH